jgi:hypothetical protein
MTTAMTKRLARAVLIAGLALPATTLLPVNAPFAISKAFAGGPTTVAEFKSILAGYGKWGTHDKYGDIWVPTVTPPGWHPYPACQWVFTKQGWYFNDTTAWGSIVHHYGRWQNDLQIGWFWVPDQDWSPGWVVWRQSDQWVGWAPMPPQQDVQLVSSSDFNNDKLWTFMAADKFRSGGCGDTVVASQAFYQTQPVTWFGLYPGLSWVDIDIDQHWTIKNIIKIINIDIDIDINIDIDKDCPPNPNGPPTIRSINKPSPFHFDNPPPLRTDNTPPKGRTTGGDTPPVQVFNNPGITNNPGLTIDLPSNPRHPGKVGRGDGNVGGQIGLVDGGKTSRGDGNGKIGKVGLVDGGKVSRGDGGGSRTAVLNYPRGLNLGSTGNTCPMKTMPLSVGPRPNSLGMGGKGLSILR